MSKIQVDNIVNKDDNGAPDFPFGVTGTDATNAGNFNSYVVSVVPNITVASGIGVTVGLGKTMVIDVLNLAGLTTSL